MWLPINYNKDQSIIQKAGLFGPAFYLRVSKTTAGLHDLPNAYQPIRESEKLSYRFSIFPARHILGGEKSGAKFRSADDLFCIVTKRYNTRRYPAGKLRSSDIFVGKRRVALQDGMFSGGRSRKQQGDQRQHKKDDQR